MDMTAAAALKNQKQTPQKDEGDDSIESMADI